MMEDKIFTQAFGKKRRIQYEKRRHGSVDADKSKIQTKERKEQFDRK